jgi:hypothetical protein
MDKLSEVLAFAGLPRKKLDKPKLCTTSVQKLMKA